jgi:sigma-E factor negative regulatory protein RseB
MTRGGLRLAGGLLALLATLACHAQAPQPAELLERMSRSLQSLEYEGVFVYVHEGRVDAVQVTRTQSADGPVDRLVTLSGDRREVVREGRQLRCLTPGGTVTASAGERFALLAPDPAQVARLQESYRFSIAGNDRVAGFDATVIDAVPLDAYRYAYRLWLERASGMLLASMLREPAGGPVEQLAFTSLRLRESGLVPVATAPEPAPAAPAGWTVADLPPGFRLIARPQAPNGGEHLLYSDGLASVSVYIERGAASLLGAARRGAVNAYGRALGEVHVVVVGDLPAATVARIAASVRRVG